MHNEDLSRLKKDTLIVRVSKWQMFLRRDIKSVVKATNEFVENTKLTIRVFFYRRDE